MISQSEYRALGGRTSLAPALGLGLVLALGLAVGAKADPVGVGVAAGPVRVYPAIEVEFLYHSNYLRSDASLLPDMATWENVVAPSLRLSALKGTDVYNLSYLARIGTISDNTDYNYVDQGVNADASWEFGSSHRLRADYEYLNWTDRPGSGDPSLTSRSNFFYKHPDRWESNRAQLGYSFGSPGAKGRLDLTAAGAARHYLNNNQETRDNNRGLLDATFFWRIQPRTSLLFGANWQTIDYTNELPGSVTSDSEEWRLYTGATWDATAKTTGTVKLGYLAKDFTASEYQDYSSIGWEANLQWRPRTYSIFNLVTSRNPFESATPLSDAVVVSAIGLDWVHYWKSYLRSRLDLLGTNDEYLGEDRVDHRYQVGAGVFFQPKRWAELGLQYRYETRTSDIPLAEYIDNVLMLTLDARY
jgi:hypothetical protein